MLTQPTEPASGRQLLIVENERNIRELVRQHLRAEGYECTGVATGAAALEIVQTRRVDLIVLDLMLPGISGLSLCQTIRAGRSNPDVPILMLTARCDESDKLAGFRSGADDYLTKPFSLLELTARVGALTRRVRKASSNPLSEAPVIIHGDIRLDPARRSLLVQSASVPITRQEFRLLYELASHPGITFTRERLLSDVWQGEAFVTGRSIDTLVRRLRCKIERDPSDPRYLVTVWGEGYKFANG